MTMKTKDADIITQLDLQIKELKQENMLCREKYIKALDKIEDMEGKEREFQAQIIKEEQEKRKKVSSDLKKVEADNARLRKERDSFKHKYDLKCVRDGDDSKVNHEIKTLMSNQKVKIRYLIIGED